MYRREHCFLNKSFSRPCISRRIYVLTFCDPLLQVSTASGRPHLNQRDLKIVVPLPIPTAKRSASILHPLASPCSKFVSCALFLGAIFFRLGPLLRKNQIGEVTGSERSLWGVGEGRLVEPGVQAPNSPPDRLSYDDVTRGPPNH